MFVCASPSCILLYAAVNLIPFPRLHFVSLSHARLRDGALWPFEDLHQRASDAELARFLAEVWAGRTDRYSDERAALLAHGESRAKFEMSYIGG